MIEQRCYLISFNFKEIAKIGIPNSDVCSSWQPKELCSKIPKMSSKLFNLTKDWQRHLKIKSNLKRKLASLTSELESIYATAKVCRQTNTRNKRDDSSETNEQIESMANNDDHIDDSINKESSESSIEEAKTDTSDDTTPRNDDCLSLEPGLTQIMQNSRDYDELKWAWTGWHNESGRKMRSIYTQTVQIQNNAARENNYTDLSDYWIDDFEDDQFEQNAAELFESIKPLYQKIHTYVRGKLENVYGAHYPEWHDPQLIPAHLLGFYIALFFMQFEGYSTLRFFCLQVTCGRKHGKIFWI